MKFEVRCCCEADKLLGWLDLPERCAAGNGVTFALQTKSDFRNQITFNQITLTFAKVSIPSSFGMPIVYRALKADGIDIKTLRKIRAFEENKASI